MKSAFRALAALAVVVVALVTVGGDAWDEFRHRALSDDGLEVAAGSSSVLGPDAPFAQVGTEAGLPTLARTAHAASRVVISQVRTAGRGPRTGYDRELFGPAWADDTGAGVELANNGCDTRNDILARDLVDLEVRSDGCLVATGQLLLEPYTGEPLVFTRDRPDEVHIDHIVSLSAAWQMGAAHWSPEKRLAFANDPVNLIATDGPQNMAKSDSTPASWLPPHRAVRCAYALRYAQISLRYDLAVTPADQNVMLEQCPG